jgi:hypothetical protein
MRNSIGILIVFFAVGIILLSRIKKWKYAWSLPYTSRDNEILCQRKTVYLADDQIQGFFHQTAGNS